MVLIWKWVSAIWSDVVRLLWSKADVYDLVHSRYFTIWPQFGTGYLRFTPIWSDLVIRVQVQLQVSQSKAKMCNGRRDVPLCPACVNEK